MPELVLRVGGRDYAGWKTIRVTRGIECVAGSFAVSVSDRWADQDVPWPIGEEDECVVLIDGEPVITGYVDRRDLSYGPEEHTLTIGGRDKAAALVDCSALPGQWEYWGIPLLTLVQRLAKPFGIVPRLQPGLKPPSVPTRLAIDPGDSALDVIERACRVAGVLPVSDGAGGLVLTRPGSARTATSLVEGQNVLGASARYDASHRYRRYVVMGQQPGSDQGTAETTAFVRGYATDPNVRRAERVLVVRSENSITPEQAKRRAQWEATVRAARGDEVTALVQGWKQGNGELWPVNELVKVRLPYLGVSGELLISQATYSLDDHSGTTTELWLKRPDAFVPEPVIPSAAWKELAGGV